MAERHSRIARESKTIAVMIALYCQGNHQTDGLCPECAELRNYARQRLEGCPFQDGKQTCAKCPVHCYKPDMREEIRTVMRYAGPRMLYTHPLKTAYHMVDGLRKEPVRRRRGSGDS